MMLMSSISSVVAGLGYVAYGAGNAFMDAFAHARQRSGDNAWISVDWDTWEFEVTDESVEDPTVLAMTAAEGVDAFRRILCRVWDPQVIVSTGDLDARVETWVNPRSLRKGLEAGDGESDRFHSRPQIATAHVAPRSQLERSIVSIWEQTLGFARSAWSMTSSRTWGKLTIGHTDDVSPAGRTRHRRTAPAVLRSAHRDQHRRGRGRRAGKRARSIAVMSEVVHNRSVSRGAPKPSGRTFAGMAEPLFILATPRAFSSVVSTMLGQHPQMYGLPETHLFVDDSLEGWWARASGESFQMTHGLLRAVADIFFGGQTEETVALAIAWLKRRGTFTSGMVFEELARAVAPAILIEKSPNSVYSTESLQRLQRFFPQARFMHLVRHPRGYCSSVIKYMRTLAKPAYQPRDGSVRVGPPEWLNVLAHFAHPTSDADGGSSEEIDPQGGWYVYNHNVARFLESVPADQQLTMRGEDLLQDPDRQLVEITRWLGVRTDSDAVDEMKHPERSPYARFGPRGARLGNDILFLERPAIRPGRGHEQSLDGPLSWRTDGAGFTPEVAALARRLGYT